MPDRPLGSRVAAQFAAASSSGRANTFSGRRLTWPGKPPAWPTMAAGKRQLSAPIQMAAVAPTRRLAARSLAWPASQPAGRCKGRAKGKCKGSKRPPDPSSALCSCWQKGTWHQFCAFVAPAPTRARAACKWLAESERIRYAGLRRRSAELHYHPLNLAAPRKPGERSPMINRFGPPCLRRSHLLLAFCPPARLEPSGLDLT